MLNAPVSWSLELCAIAYVWVVFWSAGVLVPRAAAHRLRRALPLVPAPGAALGGGLPDSRSLGLVFLAALPGVLDYIRFLGRRSTMLLHLRMDLVYACFAIFMVAVIVGAALRLRRPRGRALARRDSEGRPS